MSLRLGRTESRTWNDSVMLLTGLHSRQADALIGVTDLLAVLVQYQHGPIRQHRHIGVGRGLLVNHAAGRPTRALVLAHPQHKPLPLLAGATAASFVDGIGMCKRPRSVGARRETGMAFDVAQFVVGHEGFAVPDQAVPAFRTNVANELAAGPFRHAEFAD